jgi:hypothetical protein
MTEYLNYVVVLLQVNARGRERLSSKKIAIKEEQINIIMIKLIKSIANGHHVFTRKISNLCLNLN